MVTSTGGHDEVDVFVELNVGKGEHHTVALERADKRLFDRALPNVERLLRAQDQLRSRSVVLLVVGHATAGHLAATPASPITRRSGTSICGEHPSRGGNKILKRAMLLFAFAALRDSESRAYYNPKIVQGMRHNRAVIPLALGRSDIFCAMLRGGILYQPGPAELALTA